jgi:hypothetical protein
VQHQDREIEQRLRGRRRTVPRIGPLQVVRGHGGGAAIVAHFEQQGDAQACKAPVRLGGIRGAHASERVREAPVGTREVAFQQVESSLVVERLGFTKVRRHRLLLLAQHLGDDVARSTERDECVRTEIEHRWQRLRRNQDDLPQVVVHRGTLTFATGELGPIAPAIDHCGRQRDAAIDRGARVIASAEDAKIASLDIERVGVLAVDRVRALGGCDRRDLEHRLHRFRRDRQPLGGDWYRRVRRRSRTASLRRTGTRPQLQARQPRRDLAYW